MSVRLKKQTIEILKVLKKKANDVLANDLAKELKIDYIVLMSAVNDLLEHELGGFKEDEVDQVYLNEEGVEYLKNGLPDGEGKHIDKDGKIWEGNFKEGKKIEG